jgi:hypothetical protein
MGLALDYQILAGKMNLNFDLLVVGINAQRKGYFGSLLSTGGKESLKASYFLVYEFDQLLVGIEL